jgi:hypothetical protein
MTINWEKKQWNTATIEEIHGQVFKMRDIYEGKHIDHFERAQALLQKKEINDPEDANLLSPVVRTPYIVMNIAKPVAETPANLIARSIGKITSSLKNNEEVNAAADAQGETTIDGEGKVDDLQNEIIRTIVKKSDLDSEHWSNIVQHQIDGGIVGMPVNDARGLRIEFKSRDVFFPHDDKLGADIAYKVEIEDEKYLRVYRERIVENETDPKESDVVATHMLYYLNDTQLKPVPENEAARLLGVEELVKRYETRSDLFIKYLANNKTFMKPWGVPSFDGLLGHQDEINIRLTRNAIIFERNSSPRLAITEDIFAALEDDAFQRFGESGRGFINHELLEVVTMDENGKSMEVIQVDVKNIGGIEWVDKLIREVLVMTNTSQKAIDYFTDDAANNAVSGVAKFYDLFVSIVKAERIQKEYVAFLKHLIEACLWLENQDNPLVIPEEPEIALNEMVPVTRTDLIAENLAAYEAGGISLETFVRRTNPFASEEWIQEEITRIEEEKQTADSTGIPSFEDMNDQRDENGDPIVDPKETDPKPKEDEE